MRFDYFRILEFEFYNSFQKQFQNLQCENKNVSSD